MSSSTEAVSSMAPHATERELLSYLVNLESQIEQSEEKANIIRRELSRRRAERIADKFVAAIK